jgi:anti-sigma-K factor RskA
VNINEIISSGLLESYVLGTASAEETELVNDLCKKQPELNTEIELIEAALINYSAQSIKPINEEVKQKISDQLFKRGNNSETGTTIIPLQAPPVLRFYKVGIAASLLLLVASGVYISSLHNKLNKLNGEIAELSSSKSYLADELKVQQASITTLNSQFRIISNPKFKAIALNGMNSMATHSALIHWNAETNEVYFDAQAMPMSPINKQYQLWAIVNGKPVNAGMIDLASTTVFQKMKLIKGAQAFAVTIENMGGSQSPTIETMCLLGNV